MTATLSDTFKGRNLRWLDDGEQAVNRQRVGFVLLDHFSLPCFTQALSVLNAANLIRPGSARVQTFSQHGLEVMSDLGIAVRPDTPLSDVRLADLDLLLVCAGLRTPRATPPWLETLLRKLAALPVALGGLWSGAWHLGKAGLLNGYQCAVHPELRGALAEQSPRAQVMLAVGVLDRDRLTAATPAGAFQAMSQWLREGSSPALTDAVVDLLDYNPARPRVANAASGTRLSRPLRALVALMETHLETPLVPAALAEHAGLSLRQVQRLFREQLGTTPQRYYLQVRITEARRLIQHTTLPLIDVSIACGFATCSHFSTRYSALFGYPPSKEVRLEV